MTRPGPASLAPAWWRVGYAQWIGPWLQREDPRRISIFDRSSLFLLLVTCIWYFVAYLGYDATPGLHPGDFPGWSVWFDQGQYYKTTVELAHGELKPSIYWLGYPLMGAPFYWLLPRHPYFIPNVIMVLIMVGSFFASCRYFMGRLEAWLLIGFFIFFESILRDKCLIVPWNTTPAYAAIYLAAYLLIFGRARLRDFALCALAIGIAFLSRPNEIIPLGIIYLCALSHLQVRERWWAFVFIGVTGTVAVMTTLSLNLYFYGHLSSPYMVSESRKFSLSNLGLKLYQFLCDGAFLTGNAGLPAGTRTTQILERFPYFLLLLPGALYLARARGFRMGGLFLAIILTLGFYLCYNLVDNSAYFWTFGSFHYLWWMIPWLGFITYVSFRQAPFAFSRRTYFLALTAPVVIYLLVGFKAVEVASSDAVQGPIAVSSQYEDQTYLVTLHFTSYAGVIEDLRLQFVTPPSYSGSDSANISKVQMEINGAGKAPDYDYTMSQDGLSYNFSFLGRSLRLKAGDRITIKFLQTTKPALGRTSLLAVRFSPGNAVARFFTP